MSSPRNGRRTQADRRAHTRRALLEAAARGLARQGYANLVLERVAAEAGYTRGALYHLFANKEELALAVVHWIAETWDADVGAVATREPDPVEALLTMTRGTVVYCRDEAARALMTLRIEFDEDDHAVGRAIAALRDRLAATCADLVRSGRARGDLPAGPPPEETAAACLSVVDAIAFHLAGRTPLDVEFAERAVRGVLGLAVPPVPAPGA